MYSSKNKSESFGQDGDIGRYASLPRKTKKRITNLKTKNNQNCQKIKLYGSSTTKELKKKHPSRLVGGVETGSHGRKDVRQSRGWLIGQSYIGVQISQEEQLGSKTNRATQGSSARK